MFLDVPLDVILSVTRFRRRVHTLCYETATWNHMCSTTYDRCEANDNIQDEQHVIFQCTIPLEPGGLSPLNICSSFHSDRIS